MFSKIWNYLVNVEQTVEHDVEAIISTFTDTVTKLEDAVVAKNAEAAAHDIVAHGASLAAAEARDAAKRAYDVACKINDLVA
jgi:hypothetical protein